MIMRSKATLKNLSQKLNLSISTISRALKNHPDISEETKKKVTELANLMEYEPNPHAINLRTNKSKLFGLIVPEISNFFYHSFIATVEQEARKAGYSLLILQSANDPQVEEDNLKLCRLNRVDGVFVSITSHTEHMKPFQKLEEYDIPVIFFDKVPDYEACNKICIDDEEAATIAADALVRQNKEKVLAIFGDPHLSITQKREKAFCSFYQKHAPQATVTCLHAYNSKEAESFTQKTFENKQPFDSVFCMSDEILTGTMKAIQKLKLRIPKDISVISICNNDFIPFLYEPEISFVETSGSELGKLAFKRMMDHLNGKTFIQELTVPVRLVPGHSL